jgi:hypothetical protein
MGLLEAKLRLSEAEKYLSLTDKLAKTVDERFKPVVLSARNYLKNCVEIYQEAIVLENEMIKLETEEEDKYAKAIDIISEAYGLDYETAKKKGR